MDANPLGYTTTNHVATLTAQAAIAVATQTTQAAVTEATTKQETYQFTITSCNVTQYADRNCNCGDTDGVIEISGDEITIQFYDRGKILFIRQDSGGYTNSRNWGEANLSLSTLTLNDDGFIYITEVHDTSAGKHICTFNKTGKFIK
jgi:hypothetical protein